MALYAFDGTWNDDSDLDEFDTNVRKFYELSDEPEDHKLYMKGVGTRFGFLGKLFGGGLGIGGERRVDGAYDDLKKTWRPGEPIDVVGFSRGAALAVDFVNEIVREKTNAGAPQPPVRFLGIFDQVPAFGIPNIGFSKRFDINPGKVLTLPPGGVQYCFHAIALDECRNAFGVTRIPGAHEVWFRGCHSDIGGGNGNTKLSFIALRWMIHKAAACGVRVNAERLKAMALDAGIDPNASIQLPKDLRKNEFRACKDGDRVHYTVGTLDARADRHDCNPFTFTVVETKADETSLVPRLV